MTPRTVVHQDPLSIGFFRQEYWSGLSGPSPGDLPNPGVKPGCPALAGRFFFFFFLRPGHLGNPLLFVVRIKGDHLGALETRCGTKSVNVSYSYLLSDFCLTHTLGDRASEAIMQTETNIRGTTTGKTKFLEIQWRMFF